MKFRPAAFLILTTVLLSACNFSLASDITPPPDYKSPTPAPTLSALFPAEPPAPQEGLSLYMEKCAPCHGEQGRGDGPQGLQLSVKVPAFGLPDAGRAAIPTNYFTIVSQGRIENFMPPFSGSLSEQQRWNVVAYAISLHTSAVELAQGKTLYETNCTTCHGVDGAAIAKTNLSDQQFMAKRSEQDLFSAMTNGVPDVMPAYNQLTADDRWVLAAYVRSLTFAEVQATATPQPSPTAVATSTPAATTPEGTSMPASTAESTSQPVLDATPVPTVLPNTTGTVTGSVANASGGALPAGLTVKLLGFDPGQNNAAPTQVIDLSTQVQANGSYTFENVEIPVGRSFIAQVEYQGVPYGSDMKVIEKDATGFTLTLINLYDTTDDLASLEVKQGHVILQFDTARIGVLEFFAISNPGKKMVVFTSDGQTLPFAPMPEGVELLGFDLTQGDAQFIQTADGFAVPPSDKLYAAVTGFALPYNNGADITVPLGIAIPVLNLIAPEGVKITSDQLTSQPANPQSQNQVFLSGPFNIGDQLSFNVSGTPKTESAPATSADTNTGLLIGVGALGLAFIVAGVFLFLRDRRRKQDGDDEVLEEPVSETAEEIMDAIITLDDQYRAGNISEEVYQQRRADLKALLKGKL
jgi:mono/diheme cytochrome c family protein